MQTNLYKCFLPLAWTVGKKETGVSAFLHPEGIYDDPKGGRFREALYPRLRYHFQFQNESKLFAEVHNETKFSVNVFENSADSEKPVQLHHIANLFAPSTVDACFMHAGYGPVPGIKDDDNRWNLQGHKDRIIEVRYEELSLFARLYDETGTPPLQARLPALHSRQFVGVLHKFASQPRRLGDLKGEYVSTVMWDETNAVKKDHTIRRETRFPAHLGEWILSGPHFFVGNPFFKTPRKVCNTNRAYDILDLTTLPDDYLPRTNYLPDCDLEEYRKRTPKFRTKHREVVVTDSYRLANRRMLSQSGERTFISCIMPKNCRVDRLTIIE
jgi:hypothetical protein